MSIETPTSKHLRPFLAVAAGLLATFSLGAAGVSGAPAVPDASIQACLQAATRMASEYSVADLVGNCFGIAMATAPGVANRTSSTGDFQAVGSGNVLFTQERDIANPQAGGTIPVKQHAISGSNPLFKDITALALDEQHRELYVLDATAGNISVYPYSAEGNVHPKRFLTNTALVGATSLAVDPIHDQILVLNSTRNSLVVFKRGANAYNKSKPENSIDPQQTIDLTGLLSSGTTFSDLAVAPSHSEILALDSGNWQIDVFTMANARPPMGWILGQAGTLAGTAYVEYSASDDTVRAMRSDGSGLAFTAKPPATVTSEQNTAQNSGP